MSAPSTDTASTTAPVESDAGGVNDKANELRELHNDELETRLGEAKEELFNLRFQTATGQLDNNRRLRTVRHDIARIYTILRERELGLSVAPNEGEGS
jgi:large subunit ribosomal protein L29